MVEFTRRLGRLWRHPRFRKLTIVRLLAQSGDGTVQIGMASYLLFNPQTQPNAWAIAGILALTQLPFSFVGPLVSVVLDRFPRQRIAVAVDTARLLLSVVLAGLIATSHVGGGFQALLMAVLLVMLSLNRFTLAGLTAGLPYTIDDHEYLDASSVMPMIGPFGAILGGAIAAGVRLSLDGVLGLDRANGLIFLFAAAMFAGSVAVAWQIPRLGLGPDATTHRTSLAEVARGLAEGFAHLRSRRPAWLGIRTILIQRIGYGLLTVSMILAYRHHFHSDADLDAAMVDMGVWFGAVGAGFLLSGVVAVPLARFSRGVREAIIALLLVCAVAQGVLGSVFWRPTLVLSGFLIGLASQSLKAEVDTVVQAHTDDAYRGRVFTIYDMVFNVANVVGAILAAAVLPADGLSVPVSAAMGVGYLLLAWWFARRSVQLGSGTFNRGTQLGEPVSNLGATSADVPDLPAPAGASRG